MIDRDLVVALNGLAALAPLDRLALALSSRWMLVVVGLPLALYWGRSRRWWVILSVVLATASADVVSARLVKPLFDRARPCHVLDGLHLPDGCGPGRSLPSTHASDGFALATAAAAALPPLGRVIIFGTATLVSASRVVLGVHYPSDVLAGALLGALLGYGAYVARRLLELSGSSLRPRRRPATSERDPHAP